jgi:hypothetical protein
VPTYTPPVNETTSPYQFDGAITAGGGNISAAMSPMTPADFSLKSWNFPLWMCTGTATWLPLGSVLLTAVHLSANLTYSNIYLNLATCQGSAGVGSNFVGIYNSAGTLVQSSSDLSGVLGTGTTTAAKGMFTFPLATAYTPPAGGLYYVGIEFNCLNTSSIPVLYGIAGQTASNSLTTLAGQIGVAGLSASAVSTAAPYAWSAIATTAATALPGTFALGSAGTTGAQVFWCGLA